MKKIILSIVFAVFIIFFASCVFAEDNTTLEEQQEEFGVQDFIKNSKEFGGDFFEDIDINEVLKQSITGKVDNSIFINKILNIFGKEIRTSISTFIGVIAIIIIHSILKSISENVNNSDVSKIVYYVQYIAIVTIIMSNFSDVVKMVQDTSSNLVSFMNTLVPLLIALMFYTGSIATSSLLEPLILGIINFIGYIIQNFLIPLMLIFASLIIISKISNKVKIDKLTKFIKSGILWFMGIVLTIFVGIVSLEGTMSASVDRDCCKDYKGNCKFSSTSCW